VVVAFCCICLISVPCSISFFFATVRDWIQRRMTFLWYVNVALCCICLTNVLAYQFFCCCVTGHSLARSSCGMWMSSPIASVWLNCQHIISFPILFDWTSSCTTLLWYVNVVSSCNYLISFFVAYQFFLLFCDCLLPCTIFLWYVNVAFCCSCLTSIPRSISFLPFFLCDWPLLRTFFLVVCGCPFLFYLSNQDP